MKALIASSMLLFLSFNAYANCPQEEFEQQPMLSSRMPSEQDRLLMDKAVQRILDEFIAEGKVSGVGIAGSRTIVVYYLSQFKNDNFEVFRERAIELAKPFDLEIDFQDELPMAQ